MTKRIGLESQPLNTIIADASGAIQELSIQA